MQWIQNLIFCFILLSTLPLDAHDEKQNETRQQRDNKKKKKKDKNTLHNIVVNGLKTVFFVLHDFNSTPCGFLFCINEKFIKCIV